MWAAVIVAIVFGCVYNIVRMGIRHSENLERIKHGYPLRDGSRPGGYIEVEGYAKDEADYKDLRTQKQ